MPDGVPDEASDVTDEVRVVETEELLEVVP